MKKKVSVVIVTYNRPKDVLETVESLLRQSVKPFEIIVIDDGSNPPVTLEFQSENLKVIRFDQEVGLSNARNHGVKIANGEYIAFIDDDAIAEKNWVEEIQKGLESADVIGGPIRPLYQTSPPKWWNEKDLGGYAGVGNIFCATGEIWGCNMAFGTNVFKTVGLFNPNLGRRKGKLFSDEEFNLIERARSKGFGVKFIQTAVVYHKVPPKRMTFAYIMRWNYTQGKSKSVSNGYQPLQICYSLLLYIFTMANPRVIISEKSAKIKIIARMTQLLGRLF